MLRFRIMTNISADHAVGKGLESMVEASAQRQSPHGVIIVNGALALSKRLRYPLFFRDSSSGAHLCINVT